MLINTHYVELRYLSLFFLFQVLLIEDNGLVIMNKKLQMYTVIRVVKLSGLGFANLFHLSKILILRTIEETRNNLDRYLAWSDLILWWTFIISDENSYLYFKRINFTVSFLSIWSETKVANTMKTKIADKIPNNRQSLDIDHKRYEIRRCHIGYRLNH